MNCSRAAGPSRPQWLITRLGPDYFSDVKVVMLGPDHADAVMASVGRLRTLGGFHAQVHGTELTDAGLTHLRGLAQLRELNLLSSTHLTGACLAIVKDLKPLQRLSFFHAALLCRRRPRSTRGIDGLRYPPVCGARQSDDAGRTAPKGPGQYAFARPAEEHPGHGSRDSTSSATCPGWKSSHLDWNPRRHTGSDPSFRSTATALALFDSRRRCRARRFKGLDQLGNT